MVHAFPFTRTALPALLFFSAALCCYAVRFHGRPADVITCFHLFIYTNPASGPEMYAQYCAGCHGNDGQGHGTAAPYCTVPPANLTLLTKKNRGLFPAKHVAQVLHSGTGKTPQGQGYMPVWAPLLQSMNADKPETTEIRIANLTEYVGALQARPAAPRAGHVIP